MTVKSYRRINYTTYYSPVLQHVRQTHKIILSIQKTINLSSESISEPLCGPLATGRLLDTDLLCGEGCLDADRHLGVTGFRRYRDGERERLQDGVLHLLSLSLHGGGEGERDLVPELLLDNDLDLLALPGVI